MFIVKHNMAQILEKWPTRCNCLGNLLFRCSLIAQHVSSVIISHNQELLNCNYSFWFYSRLSLPVAVMAEFPLSHDHEVILD